MVWAQYTRRLRGTPPSGPSDGASGAAEEGAEGFGGLLGRFLREEVAGADRATPDVVPPRPPEREQRPGPEAEGESSGGALPHRLRRQDVQHGQAIDAVGMVDRHAVGHAAAPIVPRHREARESQPLHRPPPGRPPWRASRTARGPAWRPG